jgi:endonuclease/exonuclease/phosphatase family metal-dependent hydrolase
MFDRSRLLAFIVFGAMVLFADAAWAAGHEPVRVASFNIRFGSADDGPDSWPLRRDRVVEMIGDLDADVVGVQEALSFQIRELLDACPRYAATGVSREDGRTDGEASPILFDRARYTLAEAGTFWLSDTPDEVGTNTWGAACNRVCSWARLVDLSTGEAFVVLNTHWDHVSQVAREKSAALIRARAGSIASGDRVIVMGDLNSAEGNPALAALLGDGDDDAQGDGTAVRLVDTYRVLQPDGPAGTFTGFRVDSDGGERKIDYVLAGPGWRVRGAGIDRRLVDGRYPSDHFPVWAELEPVD